MTLTPVTGGVRWLLCFRCGCTHPAGEGVHLNMQHDATGNVYCPDCILLLREAAQTE